MRDENRYCEIMTGLHTCSSIIGLSSFYISLQTEGDKTKFLVEGGTVEIDWGNGEFFTYNPGEYESLPLDSNKIIVKSVNQITNFKLLTDTVVGISIAIAKDLPTMENRFSGLAKLRDFSIEKQLPLVTN